MSGLEGPKGNTREIIAAIPHKKRNGGAESGDWVMKPKFAFNAK